MWAVGGGGESAGLPVFTKGGQPVGFLAMQKAAEGVDASEEGGLDILGLAGAAQGMGVFVLPIETVRPVGRDVDALRGQTKMLKQLKTETTKAGKKVAELEVMLNQLDKMLKSSRDDYGLGDAGLGSWTKKQRFATVSVKQAAKKLLTIADKAAGVVG